MRLSQGCRGFDEGSSMPLWGFTAAQNTRCVSIWTCQLLDWSPGVWLWQHHGWDQFINLLIDQKSSRGFGTVIKCLCSAADKWWIIVGLSPSAGLDANEMSSLDSSVFSFFSQTCIPQVPPQVFSVRSFFSPVWFVESEEHNLNLLAASKYLVYSTFIHFLLVTFCLHKLLLN